MDIDTTRPGTIDIYRVVDATDGESRTLTTLTDAQAFRDAKGPEYWSIEHATVTVSAFTPLPWTA